MPDDQIAKLTEALSSLTTIVDEMVASAKAEYLNYDQKDQLQRRLSDVRSLIIEAKTGKLDDPSLS